MKDNVQVCHSYEYKNILFSMKERNRNDETIHKRNPPPPPKVQLSPQQSCEMMRITLCLDNRLTDGSEVVSLMHQPSASLQNQFLFVSGGNFC
jgi:hypothetical protein